MDPEQVSDAADPDPFLLELSDQHNSRAVPLYYRTMCITLSNRWFIQSKHTDVDSAKSDFNCLHAPMPKSQQAMDRYIFAESVRHGHRYLRSVQESINALREQFAHPVTKALTIDPVDLVPQNARNSVESVRKLIDVPMEHAVWIEMAGKEALQDLLMRLVVAKEVLESIRTELELKEKDERAL